MSKSNFANGWSQFSGKILGQITGVWFAVMMAALLFTIPTKLVFWAISWFWHLF